jgi:hypothetical protein
MNVPQETRTALSLFLGQAVWLDLSRKLLIGGGLKKTTD